MAERERIQQPQGRRQHRPEEQTAPHQDARAAEVLAEIRQTEAAVNIVLDEFFDEAEGSRVAHTEANGFAARATTSEDYVKTFQQTRGE